MGMKIFFFFCCAHASFFFPKNRFLTNWDQLVAGEKQEFFFG